MFQTVHLPKYSEPAPDGSLIFPLVRTGKASAGLIEISPDRVSAAVRHQTIEEIWYVLDGDGELWRKFGDREEIVPLQPGTCITIPPQTAFQFRAVGDVMLKMLMVTIPPWPGDHEAIPVEGRW